MITFETEKGRFTYRVAAVCIEDDHVLLQTDEQIEFWVLPGGRCEFAESSPTALRREMQEELGLEVTVGRLLWIVENFYRHDNVDCHEIGLYYQISIPRDRDFLTIGSSFSAHDGGNEISFKWLSLSEIENLRFVPAFLKNELRNVPSHAVHIEHHDGPQSTKSTLIRR